MKNLLYGNKIGREIYIFWTNIKFIRQKIEIHSSLEDDSFFTNDILENLCRAEEIVSEKDDLTEQRQHEKSIKKEKTKLGYSFNDSPQLQGVKTLLPKNSTPIPSKIFTQLKNVDLKADRELKQKVDSEKRTRFSKRLLNKKKPASLSNINDVNQSSNHSTVKREQDFSTSGQLSKSENISINEINLLSQDEQNNHNSSSHISFEDQLKLSHWGLPEDVLKKYEENGISKMFPWQVECLSLPGVLEGENLIYSAPTSAGKTLVSEIILLKRVLEQGKKGIFILPFVSIAREKTFALQQLFGVTGIRVEGFMGGQSPPGGFQKTDIAICTIEKANNLINRLIEDKKVEDLGIIIVDELHMVGDSQRGYLLELLLTKLQYISGFKGNGFKIQVVGMSATLPNLHILAEWQKAKLYSTSFRPIPLLQMVKIGSTLYDESFSIIRNLGSSKFIVKEDPEYLIELCLETVIEGFSVLLFCPTKAWCEKIALSIAFHFFSIGKDKSEYPETIVKGIRNRLNGKYLKRVIEALRACPAGLDSVLEKSLAFGAAFHHAGLTFDERDIIEGAFRAGYLPVLVATSTLSSGVNLPARRVIIRSLNSGGRPMDPLVYKQMVGRAGRKGKDTQGESILMCNSNEKLQAEKLVTSSLPPITSCLQRHANLSTSMKRAVLEVVVSGAAKTRDDIKLYWNCTLLAVAVMEAVEAEDSSECHIKPAIEESVQYLIGNELARFQELNGESLIVGTQLGCAVLSSGLSPDEGLQVFSELQRARKCFVLENELHVVYQVTPIYVSGSWPNLDWLQFLEIWESLSPDMKKVGELVGIEEGFIVRAMKGTVNIKVQKQKNLLAIHQRFYAALALQDLVHEMSLSSVVSKYGATKGLLQALQQSAATFAGMVTIFCNKLGWHNLELLIAQYQNRLHFGIQRDLCDLVKISLLNGYRARLLFSSGIETVNQVAHSNPHTIENILSNSGPFQSNMGKRSSGFILGLNGSPLSITEASSVIVNEARSIVQKELGIKNINWDQDDNALREVKRTHDSVSNILSASNSFRVSKRHSSCSLYNRVSKSPKLDDQSESDVKDKGNDVSEGRTKIKPFSSACELSYEIETKKDLFVSGKLPFEKSFETISHEPLTSVNNIASFPHSDKKVECELSSKLIGKENISVKSDRSNMMLVKNTGKNKYDGSFLFSKPVKNQNISDHVSLSVNVPESQGSPLDRRKISERFKARTDSGNKLYRYQNGVKAVVDEKPMKLNVTENCSSMSLSDSVIAELVVTMFDNDSVISKNENKKDRTSTQSEDIFSVYSDEGDSDNSILQNYDSNKKAENDDNSLPKTGKGLIKLAEPKTPIYNACSEKIDFGFDLSKTEHPASSIKNMKSKFISQNESYLIEEDNLQLNYSIMSNSNCSLMNVNDLLEEESLIMTEGGVLSLMRENIEKDLDEFESSVMEESELPNDSIFDKAFDSYNSLEENEKSITCKPKNNDDSLKKNEILDSVFDKTFDSHHSLEENEKSITCKSINGDDSMKNNEKKIGEGNESILNAAEKIDKSTSKSLFDYSSFMLTPGTDAILDGKHSPSKRARNYLKVEYIKKEKEGSDSEIKTKKEDNVNDKCMFDRTIKVCQDLQSSFDFSALQATRSLCIIDVTANEKLFEVFVDEWKSKQEFAIALACVKAPTQPSKGGIGWRFCGRSRRTPQKKQVAGLVIDQSNLLLTGVTVSWGQTDAYFINLKSNVEKEDGDESVRNFIFPTPPNSKEVSLQQRMNAIKNILSKDLRGKTIHMWQVKETLKLLYRSGFEVSKSNFKDPRVAFWLLDPGAKQTNICNMVLTYCEEYAHLLENIGSTYGIESLGVSCEESKGLSVRVRATTESVLIFHLNKALEENLNKLELKHAWESIEMPSVYNLSLMEMNGLGFSVSECSEQKIFMQERLEVLENRAYQLAGHPFSISSPDEVSKILYSELHLGSDSKSDLKGCVSQRKGSTRFRCIGGSTNKIALEKLRDKHPLPQVILEWRRIKSALTKIVYPLCQEVIPCISLGGEERIFPVCSTFTATGRVTFHEPNVQTIPKDFLIELPHQYLDKKGRKAKGMKVANTRVMQQLTQLLDPLDKVSSYKVSLRHVIVSGKNRLLLSADYSQLELRILAHLSKDQNLLKTLNAGEDVFKTVASQIHSVPISNVGDSMRQDAKQICYGIIYGMSEKTLGEQLGLDEQESAEFISKFHQKFQGIRKFINASIKDAKGNGFVTTIGGRRRFLPEINSPSLSTRGQCERQAVNTRIQGSAADLVKKALINIQEKLKENFILAPSTLTQQIDQDQTLSGAFLILQLHDELIYEVANEDIIQVAQIVKDCMENVYKLSVFLPVNIKIGPTWGTLQTLNL